MIEKILEPYISERFMSDARYRKGHIRIINPLPGTSVLGLHIPDMRKVASQLAASDDAVGGPGTQSALRGIHGLGHDAEQDETAAGRASQ